MALNQNQFSITTLRGTLDSGSSITCQYYDADPAGLITAGEFVMLSGVAPQSVAPAVSVVKKGVDRASKYLGMVLTNPLRSFWVTGDKLEVAIIGTIAMVEAKNALPGGTSLGYDPAFPGQVAAAGAGDTVVGVAMESATSAGQLIRALIRTEY